MKIASLPSVLLCVALSNAAFAQVNAVLSGTVGDATGALIPGVEVTAKNVNTGITDTRLSNESGNFVFPSLQPGTYTLSAALSGFQTATYNNVVLGQGQQVRLNFTLQVAAAAQNVEVTIAADTVLATTSSSVGNVLPDSAVTNLPYRAVMYWIWWRQHLPSSQRGMHLMRLSRISVGLRSARSTQHATD